MLELFNQSEIAELVKQYGSAFTKAPSITTTTGLNFLPLEEEARNTYPVFHPILDMIPRVTPEELGREVGGITVTWKQITQPGTNVLPSVPEGSRSAYITIPAVTTSENYVTLGVDAAVTFESQSAGVGFNDNLGTANLAKLNTLLNLEERMAIFGNGGTSGGNNGFLLGTPDAPVVTLETGGSLGSGKSITVAIVALTGWGIYNAASFGKLLARPGIAQTVGYTSADGNTILNNGGTSLVSAPSNLVTTNSGQQKIKVAVTPIPGAFGYAAFIDSTASDSVSPTYANAYFAGVFTTSVFEIDALPATSVQRLSDLTDTDYSANPASNTTTGDFDGIATWLAGSQAGARPAYWKDLADVALTSDGAGGIVEFEVAIASQWQTYQVTPDAILVSSDLVPFVNIRMQTSPSGSGAATFFVREGAPGKGMGGSLIEEYKCKYSAFSRSKVLPIRNIPWLPANTVLMPTFNNPYPAAGDAIPSNFRMVCREGYYGLKFPYTSRIHSMGIFVEEALECYVPWAGILLTSVGDA